MYYQGKTGEIQINYPLKEPLSLELNHVVEAVRNSNEVNTNCSKRSLYTVPENYWNLQITERSRKLIIWAV